MTTTTTVLWTVIISLFKKWLQKHNILEYHLKRDEKKKRKCRSWEVEASFMTSTQQIRLLQQTRLFCNVKKKEVKESLRMWLTFLFFLVKCLELFWDILRRMRHRSSMLQVVKKCGTVTCPEYNSEWMYSKEVWEWNWQSFAQLYKHSG